MAQQAAAALWIEIGAKIDKLIKGSADASGTLLKLERNVSGTMKKINAVINAALVVGGVAAINKLGNALTDLARKGEQLGSIEESFRKLGGTSASIDQARKATLGLVSSFDLMKVANAGLVAGIPNFNENFSKIADLGARLANTLGIDTTQAIERVVDALKSGKTQALQSVGIMVDAEKVYGKFGDTLTTVEKKALLMSAGLKGIPAALQRFAEVTDSVANAQTAVGTAMDEVIGKSGIAINSNENLTRAYRELEEQIKKIDFTALAQNAADFFATLLRASNAVFPVLLSWIDDTIRGFNYLFGDGMQAQADRLAVRIGELQSGIEELQTSWKPGALLDQARGGVVAAAMKKELEDSINKLKEMTGEIEKQNKLVEDRYKAKPSSDAFDVYLREVEEKQKKSLDDTSKAAEDKAAKLAERVADKQEDELRRAYENAVDFWSDTFRNAIDGNSSSLKDNLKDLLVGFASALAASISTGVAGGLNKGGLEGVGQTIASALGSSGTFDGLANAFGFGQTTAEAHAAGIQGPGLESGQFPSGGGAETVNTVAGAVHAISAAFSAGSTDRANQDNSGTGGAIGGGIGAIWGPVGAQIGQMAGSFIGSMFKWGPQNPETQARHAFANFIEEGFEKLKTIAFFDMQGKAKTFSAENLNFIEGSSGRFNDPNWGASMEMWGDKAKTTFLGLGEALEEMLELTEDVGGQIGFLLGENLAGNIDNARLLVYQLGLSFEEMEAALVKTGLSGEMSWHEVEVALQGVGEAFQPGIEAVGDLEGAIEQLTGTGGRGAAAIKSVKDIAVEALQAGAETLADLPRVMMEDGVTTETIDAIMRAIQGRGIKTLEELAAVSDRVGGGIIADIESNSAVLQAKWKDMSETIKEIEGQLASLPEKLQTDVTINVKANITGEAQAAIDAINQGSSGIDLGTEAFANGGILNSRTRFGRGIAGEAGSEAILPLKTMPNGRLGVEAMGGARNSGGTLVINAQGAGPGVENTIRQEIEAMGNEAVSRAIQAAQDIAGRGGRYADY